MYRRVLFVVSCFCGVGKVSDKELYLFRHDVYFHISHLVVVKMPVNAYRCVIYIVETYFPGSPYTQSAMAEETTRGQQAQAMNYLCELCGRGEADINESVVGYGTWSLPVTVG